MPNPECGGGEGVGDARVEVVAVVGAEAASQGVETELFHELPTEDDRQPLVVHQVLPSGHHDSPGFLKQST